jgi:hypothetical protein
MLRRCHCPINILQTLVQSHIDGPRRCGAQSMQRKLKEGISKSLQRDHDSMALRSSHLPSYCRKVGWAVKIDRLLTAGLKLMEPASVSCGGRKAAWLDFDPSRGAFLRALTTVGFHTELGSAFWSLNTLIARSACNYNAVNGFACVARKTPRLSSK